MSGARIWGLLLLASMVAACTSGTGSREQTSRDTFAGQVTRGATVYAARCAACHGANLEGGAGIDLAGIGPAYRWVGQTADDLFQRVVTMPKGAPQSLPQAEYVDLTAFLVARNGGQSTTPLSADAPSLQQVKIGIQDLGLVRARTTTRRDISRAIASGPNQGELNRAGEATSSWLHTNHDYDGQRFVDLSQIDRANAASLLPACLFQAGDLNPFATSPLVYGGALFFTTRNAALSIDAATCRLNWRYERPSRVPSGYGLKMHRGAAIKDGKIVFGTNDGFLVALDAGTGKEIWVRDVVDPKQNQGAFTMPPVIFDDLVVIGPAGSELGARGWVGAFRLTTGEPVWRFNTIPDAGEPGADTWPDQAAREHGGGTVWGSMSVNVKDGLVYVPVSNPGPAFSGERRAGANLYTSSMVTLDVRTGKLIWYHQVSPHDTHDYDVTHAAPQISVRVDGKLRNLLIVAGKEGQIHALDRDTHALVYEAAVAARQNTDLPWTAVDTTANGTKVCPGSYGGIEWSGPAFDPRTNLLYVPSVEWCGTTTVPADQSRGWLTAIDTSNGRIRWRYESKRPMLAAVTATSGGVVFTGEVTGDFLALDAYTGKVLLRFNTGGPMLGGVVTYELNGRQYVAVATGAASNLWQADPGSSTIVVFALPKALPR